MVAVAPLWRNTRYQFLWAGSAVSQLGTEISKLAMPLLVLASTGSSASAGLVAAAGVAGGLLVMVPAGVWVDRRDRRRILLVAATVRVLVAVALAVVVLGGHPQIWLLALLGAVGGGCEAFTGLVALAAIRGLVLPQQLRAAYTQEEARSHAARLAGPPLGGLLYGIGAVVPFLVDAVTFAVALAGAALAQVPRRPPAEPSDADRPRRRGMHREVGEALGWLWRQPGLRALYPLLTALNLIGGAFTIPLIVLVGDRGAGPAGTGAVLAGAGIGGLVGALAAPVVGRLLPVGAMMVAITAVFGASVAAMALPLGPWWPIVPLVVLSLSTPSINVVMDAVTARLVPQDMLGRMQSVLHTVARGLAPLGPVAGGALAAGLGAAGALLVVGGALLLAAALAAATGELRRFVEDGSEAAAG